MKNIKLGLLVLLSISLVFFLSGCSLQNKSPTARFSPDPESGEAPLVVSFNASESTDPDGEIISYDWKVDGESIEGGTTAGHTFNEAGEWNVELTVTDDEGAQDRADATIYVTTSSNEEPEARISTDPEPTDGIVTVEVGEEVEFDAGDSSDPDGEIESYEWEFDDQTPPDNGESATHSYEEPGDYTVTLTVTDDAYGRDSVTVEVEVEPEELLASFTWEPDSPETGDEVTFDASESTGRIDTYDWDFGDGEGSTTGKIADHTYYDSGDYQVTLTVTDEYGYKKSETREITISPKPPPPP